MRFVYSLFFLMSVTPMSFAKEPLPLTAETKAKCLEVLRAGLKSSEFWPSMHAAEALTYAGYGKDVLANLATRSESDDQKRCGLAREAVRAGDRTKLDILSGILRKLETNGHTHAAESLYKVAPDTAPDAMRAATKQSSDLRWKLMACAALIRSGHDESLSTVRGYLTDEDVEIRKIAVWILGQVGRTSDVAAIRAGLPKETDLIAKAYYVHALALLGDAEGRKQLGENLRSENPAVRTYAAEFAGYCREPAYQKELVKLLDDETLDVRIRAAQSLLVMSMPAETLRGLPFAAFEKP